MQKKIYGNAQGDGFVFFMALITALFVAGGVGLAKVGGIFLVVGLPAFVVLCALMAMKLSKWDVMSEAPPLAGESAPKFPMPATSDAASAPVKSAWSTPSGETSLPVGVAKPKSGVETNTHVA